MVENSSTSDDAIVIKKYANRRLYNTATSSYVTLDTLSTMVKDGQDFVVQDAKSGTDITRSVLTQIIFEEESKGQNLLPISFLRQLIGFYGDSLQTMVPGYLESTMTTFAQNQEQIRQHMADGAGEANPFRQMEELGHQNMAMFQQAMGMFSPFAANSAQSGAPPSGTPQSGAPQSGAPQSGAPQSGGPSAPKPQAAPEPSDSGGGGGGELDRLRQQLAQMQQQLDRLSDEK